MEKVRWNIYKNITLYGILLAAWLVLAHCGPRISYAAFDFGASNVEDRVSVSQTSTDFRFPERFQKTLDRYEDFEKMYFDEFSTAIPGLEYTSTGNSYSEQMIPQGICVVGNYMLITAYDNARKENSVIYVISNKDETQREWLTTIVLPDKNHVGGIAFDGERIWLAKSISGYCSIIPYWQLEMAVLSGEDSYVLESYEENVYCGVRASFVAYHEERLWVGSYREENQGNGLLTGYKIKKTEKGTILEREAVFEIPPHAQGISFVNGKEGSHMILTASCGRYRNSDIHIFEIVIEQEQIRLTWKNKYVFPPMAEGLITSDEYTYFLFESAATCYSSQKYQRCVYPVDRVCPILNDQLLQSF